MPSRDTSAYTFDNLAKLSDEFTEQLGLKRYALYVQDYGAPVGYRLAVKHPERITAIVVQNGNAYEEGLDNDFWKRTRSTGRTRTARRSVTPFAGCSPTTRPNGSTSPGRRTRSS